MLETTDPAHVWAQGTVTGAIMRRLIDQSRQLQFPYPRGAIIPVDGRNRITQAREGAGSVKETGIDDRRSGAVRSCGRVWTL
jgi:hypothetical protein